MEIGRSRKALMPGKWPSSSPCACPRACARHRRLASIPNGIPEPLTWRTPTKSRQLPRDSLGMGLGSGETFDI